MVNSNASDVVLSVNPGTTTLGQLHPESSSAGFIRRAVQSTYVETPSKRTMLNFCFASLAPGVNRFGLQMLLVRFLIGGLLIAAGYFSSSESVAPASFGAALSGGYGISFPAAGAILTGILLALGLFTRFASIFSIFLFGGCALAASSSGIFSLQDFLLTFISIGFLLSGAGRYSSDFLIRKYIIRRATANHKRKFNKPITYKAFQHSHC